MAADLGDLIDSADMRGSTRPAAPAGGGGLADVIDSASMTSAPSGNAKRSADFSPSNTSSSSSLMQGLASALGVAGQGAAGVNTGMARAIGGIPDLLGAGMSKLGVPGIQPNYYTNMAQRGIDALAGGPAAAPQGMAQQLARTGGEGAGNALAMALPMGGGLAGLAGAAGRPITSGVMEAMAARPGAQAAAGAAGNLAGAGAQAAGAGPMGTAAASMAGSLVPGAAASVARPFVSPGTIMAPASDERQRLVDLLKNAGVPLTPAEQTGSKTLNLLEDQLGKLPFSSGVMAKAKGEQQSAFNQAVMAKTGSGAATALPEDLNALSDHFTRTYEDLTSRNDLNVTPDLARGLADAQAYANRYLPKDVSGPLHNHIEDFAKGVQQNPDGSFVLPGPTYQRLYSTLGDQSVAAGMNPAARKVIGNLQGQLRNAMEASISPEDAQLWRDTNQQYAAFKTVQKAMNRQSAGTSEGNISPAALSGAGNNAVTSAYAMGRGPLNDLGRAGQMILKQQVPDSGTAARTAVNSLIMGGPGLAATLMHSPVAGAASVGGMAAPYLASKAYNSKVGQGYLTNQLMADSGLSKGLLGSVSADDLLRLLTTPDQPRR